ncbi:MAG: DUF559 domain-containing protein [Mycobacterium sp.]
MTGRPFLGSEAIRTGRVTDHQLRTRYRAIYRNVYLHREVGLTAELRARAAWLSAGPTATLAGLSAAAVLGTKWLDPAAPAELVRPDRHSQNGIRAYTFSLQPAETQLRWGMRITTPARTACDIGRRLPVAQAVPLLDALMNATGLTVAEVHALTECRPGLTGVRRLRAALDLADGGAESPKETEVRVLCTAAGLPKPATQIEFFDDYGEAFIRVDMGWREWKVALEYDGVQHWSDARQRAWDIERLALLNAMGWTVIRVSAQMLRRPDGFVGRVRAALEAAGWRSCGP